MWRVEQDCQSPDLAIRIGGRDIKSIFCVGEFYVEYVHFFGWLAYHGPDIEYVRV
jgi:hypothetical protein